MYIHMHYTTVQPLEILLVFQATGVGIQQLHICSQPPAKSNLQRGANNSQLAQRR